MTVPVNAVKKTVVCDGQTRTWQFNFPLAAQESIDVWVKPPQGTPYKVTDHVVLDRESDEDYTYVTYPALSSGLEPLANGYQLVFERVTPLTQEIVFGTHVLPETFTQAFDKTTLQLQNLDEKISRCVRFDPDPTLSASDTNATSFVSSVLTQAQNTIQTAASAVTEALPTHNASATAHNDIRSALTQTAQTLNTALSQEQTLRQNGDGALQLNISNLSGQLSQEVSDRQSGDEELQTQITSQGEAISALQTTVAGKQSALSSAQLAAVNSGVTSVTVSQVQSNQTGIEALDAELAESRPWQKPADWMDIRSGALKNSVYFLVGHSADYSSYPKLSFLATVSAGDYDVFIDYVKYTTASSGATTTLDWQTLNLSTGWNTTYPETLKTHIVRITPSTAGATISNVQHVAISGQVNQGTLWAHFSVDSAISLERFGHNTNVNLPILEAVTSPNNELQITGILHMAFGNAQNLVTIPKLIKSDTGNCDVSLAFIDCHKLKRIELENINMSSSYNAFQNCYEITEIKTKNCTLGSSTGRHFSHCYKLKRIPNIISNNVYGSFVCADLWALEPTYFDLSANTNISQILLQASSGNTVRGIKGLVVSSSTPLAGDSPQINVSKTGMDRIALVTLFNSLPTVNASQVCNITDATGANDLTTTDLAIATGKGWTVTR